jgi:hypothetical protein
MNWYQVFYWVTVADGVKGFFDSASNWLFAATILTFVAFVISSIAKSIIISENNNKDDKEDQVDPDVRSWEKLRSPSLRLFYTFMILTIITWSLYVFIPSKKDAVLIIAGGAVGNFITSDSSAKQIPAELTLLVREKMKAEIRELKSDNVISVDTLTSKTKEELIELYKKAKQ